MSAFIVAPECINSIVTYIHEKSGRFGWLRDEFGYDVTQTQDLGRLVSALFMLNCTAVDERYGAGTAAEDANKPLFTFRLCHRDPVAVHKAACCLEYQCREGDVPEKPLFKALELIVARIAYDIVCALPAYDKAPWGE